MNRRHFISKSAVFAAVSGLNFVTPAEASTASQVSPDLIGLSEGFFEVRHRHQFVIPLAVLLNSPVEGYTARSSTPLAGQTDFDGLKNRTDSAGRPLDLRGHAHTVSLTQEQLVQLTQGRYVTIDLSKFGHQFYFVADDRTLAAIKASRG